MILLAIRKPTLIGTVGLIQAVSYLQPKQTTSRPVQRVKRAHLNLVEFASLRRDRFDRSRGRHINPTIVLGAMSSSGTVLSWPSVISAEPQATFGRHFVSIAGLIMIPFQIF